MDFDLAAKRLARDQSKLKQKRGQRGGGSGGATTKGGGGRYGYAGAGGMGIEISSQARAQAELQKKMFQERAQQKQAQQRLLEYQQQYMHECERQLRVKRLPTVGGFGASLPAASAGNNSLCLQATSIWGEGDKLALPPSVLQYLTSPEISGTDGINTQPWTFRIGILNPSYNFPASPLVQTLKPPSQDEDEHDDDDFSDSDDENDSKNSRTAAYLDELNFKYLSYTHGTVVEFTQDEGHVGLPEPIANALLEGATDHKIQRKRTIDPASSTTTASGADEGGGTTDVDMEDDEKTPGHLAWGAFDLPDIPIEVCTVQLPKGKACTLTPTREAIANGFYNLQNIKLVLEQSLIRTRATLSVGDIVHTWHRGTKFDLTVDSVTPSTYSAVICINTDIEVDFGQLPPAVDDATSDNVISTAIKTQQSTESGGFRPSGGRLLSSSESKTVPGRKHDAVVTDVMETKGEVRELLPEPPLEQTEDVCTVQLRGPHGVQGKRRFDVQKGTLWDLFAFASSCLPSTSSFAFQLATRFPRRVFTLDDQESSKSTTFAQAKIQPGQELFMLEKL